MLSTSKTTRLILSENPAEAINQLGLLNKILNAKKEITVIPDTHLFSASVFVAWHLHVREAGPASWLKGDFMRRECQEKRWEEISSFRNTNRNVKRNSCQSQCWIRNHRARMAAVKAENLHLAAIILLPFFSRNGHKNHDQWFVLFFWTKDK